jgi:hypothetical protein
MRKARAFGIAEKAAKNRFGIAEKADVPISR